MTHLPAHQLTYPPNPPSSLPTYLLAASCRYGNGNSNTAATTTNKNQVSSIMDLVALYTLACASLQLLSVFS